MRRFLRVLIVCLLLLLPVAMAQTTMDFAKLSTPANSTNGGSSTAWSPDGNLLIVGRGASPWFTIYQKTGTGASATLTALSNPASLPTGNVASVEWSPDGAFVAMATHASPYLMIYSVSGNTLTAISNPASLPTGLGTDVAWSPDGTRLAVSFTTSPYFHVYTRSGTTFTKMADPSTLPTGAGRGVSFGHDSAILAVGHTTTPFISIYTLSGSTLTKIANPATLPVGAAYGVRFSPDGEYLAVPIAVATTPYFYVYHRAGTTFTKLANPSSLPSSYMTDATWSPDSKYVIIGGDTSPYMHVYYKSGTGSSATLTKLSNPSVLPPAIVNGLSWSPAGNYVTAVASNPGFSAPTVAVYHTSLGGNPPPPTPGAPVLSGSVVGRSVVLSWTVPDGSPTGYNLTRSVEGGGVTVFTLGPGVTSYTEQAYTKNRTYNVTAFNADGSGPASNNVTLRLAPVPLLGDNGSLFGGNKDAMAEQLKVSKPAMEMLYGIVFVLIFAAAGYAAHRSGAGAGIGSVAGVFAAVAFGFIPIWLILLLVVMAGGVWMLVRRQGASG